MHALKLATVSHGEETPVHLPENGAEPVATANDSAGPWLILNVRQRPIQKMKACFPAAFVFGAIALQSQDVPLSFLPQKIELPLLLLSDSSTGISQPVVRPGLNKDYRLSGLAHLSSMPKLHENEVVEIASQLARDRKIDLSKYGAPKVYFSGSLESPYWGVQFNRMGAKYVGPGTNIQITVDDATKEAEFAIQL